MLVQDIFGTSMFRKIVASEEHVVESYEDKISLKKEGLNHEKNDRS